MRGFALLIVLAFPGAAWAQSETVPIDSVKAGAEIRVWSREPRLEGWKLKYLGRTDTSLRVADRFGPSRFEAPHDEISWSEIDRVEFNTGKRRADGGTIAHGFLVGALVGAAGGAIGGYVLAGGACSNPTECEEPIVAITLGTLGGLTGGLIGAVVGAHGTTVWSQVRIP